MHQVYKQSFKLWENKVANLTKKKRTAVPDSDDREHVNAIC